MRYLFLLYVATIVASKVCPSTPPIPIGEQFTVLCNTTLNPTGQTDSDPPCYYDDCDNDKTAVCGCVDFALFGGSGMFWGCLHSRCECDPKVREHDGCGIHGSDFTSPNFVGDSPVAGSGCTLGNRTKCLCKPVLNNGVQLEGWTWQCSRDKNAHLSTENIIIISVLLGISGLGFLITAVYFGVRRCRKGPVQHSPPSFNMKVSQEL